MPAVSVTEVPVVKAGPASTVSAKAWLAKPVEFLAVMVSG